MKKKCLVIYRLTLPARRLYIPLYRLFMKYDVYYLDMHLRYRDLKTIQDLEKAGIKWVKREYQHFSQYLSSMFDAVDYAEHIYKTVRLSHTNRTIDNILVNNESQRKKMDVFWKYYIYRAILPFAEQYAAAQFLINTGKYDRVNIIAINSLASLLKGKFERNIKVRIFPGLDFYKGYIRILKEYGGGFFKRGIRFFQSRKEKQNTTQKEDYEKSPDLKDIETYEVIYFPHQGVFYSDLFKKDHFYNDNMHSPFHKSKILHISLGEKNETYMVENYDFYKENSIPYMDLYDIGYNKKDLRKKVIQLLCKLHVRLFSDIFLYKFWYIMYALYLYTTIERYQLVFLKFKNLKVALVGYDHLFPRYLSMALSLTGVKVCATQERLIFAYWPDNFYIFDYYFVAGRAIKEEGLKSSYIDHCVPVGMMREDKLYEYEKLKIYDEKYDRIKKVQKLVLALDYHMPDDEIENTTRQGAKIDQTRQFYKDLIRLSKEFPSLHIVIKGKIADLYKSPFISDIVEEIKSIDNMEIELDLKKYNPYYIGEKADLTIACHTSLADELLAAGRKVIFYEATDLMETLLTYDNLPIIVKDYDRLKKHIENFLDGIYLDGSAIKTLREKYYANCFHGRVQKTIQEMLDKIIRDEDMDEKDSKSTLNNQEIRKTSEA